MAQCERPVPVVAGALLLTLSIVTPLPGQYDPELQYQDRVGRHEGLQPGPVSEYDVVLVSALADSRESAQEWPEKLRLRFYLSDDDDVFVTVRELEYREYYWFDKVKPPTPWRRGVFNELVWPSATVLRKTGLEMDDLGVVVRLKQEKPGKEVWIVPAILYHSRVPRRRGRAATPRPRRANQGDPLLIRPRMLNS